MRGMWSGEKSANPEYRPGVDALRAVDASLLAAAVFAAVEQGCAIMFSATRDGGATCVTLLNGNDKPKVYVSTVGELQQALNDLLLSFAPDVGPKSRQAAKR